MNDEITNIDFKKTLGVCIPTYNRSKYLRECLDHFIPQVMKYEYPIYISDNDSTDDTKEVFIKAKRRYDRIFYSKNDKNLGIAGNFEKVLNMATTEYVWIFGDDDLIAEDAIDKITEKIKLGYDYIIINQKTLDRSMEKTISPQTLEFYNDILYNEDEYNKVLTDCGFYFSYMSMMVIKRVILLKSLSEIRSSKIELTDFLSTVLYLSSIVKHKGILISEPLILTRLGNERVNLCTWIYDLPRALSLVGGYDSKALKKFMSGSHYLRYIHHVLYIRIHKVEYTQYEFCSCVKNNTYTPTFVRICMVLALKTPYFFYSIIDHYFINILRKMWKIFIDKQSA